MDDTLDRRATVETRDVYRLVDVGVGAVFPNIRLWADGAMREREK